MAELSRVYRSVVGKSLFQMAEDLFKEGVFGDNFVIIFLIFPQKHSFVDIDNEIFSYGHSLLSADSRRVVVSFLMKECAQVSTG